MSKAFVGMPKFSVGAKEALRDSQLRTNLGHATSTIRSKRAKVIAELPDWEDLRLAGTAVKDEVGAHLDHYLEQHPEIGQIDLLKIDTEGYDLKVLTGAHKTLSQAKVKMIFTEVGFSKENNLHVKLCEMIPFLEKYEYTFLGIFSMDVNNLHRRPQFGNALFIHRSLVNAVVNA